MRLAHCGCLPFQLLNQMTYFHEQSPEIYTTVGHENIVHS